MRYHARFYGRQLGAIGVCYWQNCEVEAEDETAARLKLYETHELITGLCLTPIVVHCGPCDNARAILRAIEE